MTQLWPSGHANLALIIPCLQFNKLLCGRY